MTEWRSSQSNSSSGGMKTWKREAFQNQSKGETQTGVAAWCIIKMLPFAPLIMAATELFTSSMNGKNSSLSTIVFRRTSKLKQSRLWLPSNCFHFFIFERKLSLWTHPATFTSCTMNWSASSNAERLPLKAISCFTCGGTDLEITDKYHRD